MSVERITEAQFVEKLRRAILSQTRTYDTAFGPIPQTVLTPAARVFEEQNNERLRRIALLTSLQNSSEFSEDDLQGVIFNEGMLWPEGAQASTVLTFKRRTAFGSDSGIIPRGTPVASVPDETSGALVTFLTTETVDKTSAVAVIDEDTNTTVYEVAVPALALVRGESGRVGPNRITRPLRPLVGYDSVTNKEASQQGRDRYSITEVIDLYLLAVSSRQLSVPQGSEFYVRDKFSGVEDIHEVFGTDALLTRGADDAGAVDAYVVGENLVTQTDSLIFLGVGQKIYMSIPPVVRVDSVVFDGTELVEDEDYEVALDTGGNAGSTRARDAIRILPACTELVANGGTLEAGGVLSVQYVYNSLIRDLQADSTDPEVQVEGRDLLYKMGTRVDVYLTAELRVFSTFNYTTVSSSVEDVISEYINGLGLGDDVEIFDLNAAVSRVSGVDNFTITRLVRTAAGTGADDISVAGNEYARIEDANLILTQV